MENLKNQILETIKEMDDNEIVTLWNEYCYNNSYFDDEILDGERLEDLMKNSSEDVTYWLNRFYFGDDEMGGSANPNRNYFVFNGYGNIKSFEYIYNSYTQEFNEIEIDDLIDYIVENSDALGNDDIQELLDELEEIEE